MVLQEKFTTNQKWHKLFPYNKQQCGCFSCDTLDNCIYVRCLLNWTICNGNWQSSTCLFKGIYFRTIMSPLHLHFVCTSSSRCFSQIALSAFGEPSYKTLVMIFYFLPFPNGFNKHNVISLRSSFCFLGPFSLTHPGRPAYHTPFLSDPVPLRSASSDINITSVSAIFAFATTIHEK